MSKFTKKLVDKYADDLLIGLTPEENKLVLDEFDSIDASINLINDIPGINDVTPMSHPFDLYETNLRDDEPRASYPIEDILKNCDQVEGREIEVPKVVG